jgi:hypothetical protein
MTVVIRHLSKIRPGAVAVNRVPGDSTIVGGVGMGESVRSATSFRGQARHGPPHSRTAPSRRVDEKNAKCPHKAATGGEPTVARMIGLANPGPLDDPFFRLFLGPSSFLHPPGGRVVRFRGSNPPRPRARRPSSIGHRSSNPTTRPRRPSAANRPPFGSRRNSGQCSHDGRAKILDETASWPGGRRAESDRRFQAPTEVERLRVQASLKTRFAPASANSHEVSLAVEEGARVAAGASTT